MRTSIALIVMCLVGCGTTSATQDHWTYSGLDEALRAPSRVPRGELSTSAWMARRLESEANWLQEREAAIELAKDACARETGDSKTPGYWIGYGRAFKDCMKLRGWSEGGSAI